MDKIDSFRGKYNFLSNFYNAPVVVDGFRYLNNEAAFQAMKCCVYDERISFTSLNPSDAKRRGRRIKLRSDWECIKLNCMYTVVKAKFDQNKNLRKRLIETGDSYLEEGNTWGDTCWGVCNGVGENYLGKMLMRVRDEYVNM